MDGWMDGWIRHGWKDGYGMDDFRRLPTTSDAQETEYSHVFERFPPLECTEVTKVVSTFLKRLWLI